MCVAVVVKSQNSIPENYLKAMAEHNPDGGGVAWIDGDQVQYRKGLTWQQINAMQDLLPRPFLMHFRIATRGAKIPELTHPFPIGMQAFSEDLTGMAPAVIIHNGTWGDFRKHVPNGIDADKVSDTQTAAYACAWDESILDDVRWSNAIMYAKDDKGKPKIRLRGQWSDVEGNLYSNTHWKSELDRPASWGGYGYNQEWSVSEQKWVTKKPIPSHQRAKTEPMVGRKKGESKTVAGNDFGKYSHQKLTSKRAAKRALKAAKRAEKRASATSYAQALENYNKARNPEKANNELAWGTPANVNKNRDDMAEWYKTWNAEQGQLFTKEQVEGTPGNRPLVSIPRATTQKMMGPELTSDKYIPCPECGEDIKTIPCASCAELERELEELEDLTQEVAALDAEDAEDLTELNEDAPYGMSAGLDAMPPSERASYEDGYYSDVRYDENEDLILAGDRPEDWAKVDAYIRAQGLKI